MEQSFLQFFNNSNAVDSALPASFAQRHVLRPIENMIDSNRLLSGTGVIAVDHLKSTVSGEQTSRVHCEFLTPVTDMNLLTTQSMKKLLQENLPSSAVLVTVNYEPLSRAFKWVVEFSYDRAKLEAIKAADLLEDQLQNAPHTGATESTRAAVNLSDLALPPSADAEKDSLLNKRRRLEVESSTAETEVRKSRAQREYDTLIENANSVHREGKRKTVASAPSISVRPAKRLVVPNRRHRESPLSGITKPGVKSKAALEEKKTAFGALPELFSGRFKFLNYLVHKVSGVEPVQEVSDDYLCVDK
jgi:hypothetical protein